MSDSFAARTTAFGLALLVTLTMMAGIHTLAATPAPAELMAQTVAGAAGV